LTHEYVAPRNPIEAKLAEIWVEVLGVEKVGVHDNFFELGGDSILSIQIISRARQFGIAITSKTFFQHQTVGALAENIAGTQYVEQETVEQGAVIGSVPFVPIQRWFFEQNLPNFHHWNQSVLLKVRETIDINLIKAVVEKLEQHHDVLRSRFLKKKGEWQQVCFAETSTDVFQQVELTQRNDDEYRQTIEMAATQWQQSLHLEKGPVWRVVWLDPGRDRPCYLLIVIHHLVVDGVSWRILLEDLQTCYQQALDKQSFDLPPKSTAFQYWAKSLLDDVSSGMLDDQIDYWRYQINQPVAMLPVDKPAGTNTEALTGQITEKLSRNQTDILLRETNSTYHTQINDLLLSALLQVLCDWSQGDSVRINLEGHGRESALLHPDIDLSRTVGWFTSSFPTVLILPNPATPGGIIKSVKEQLRAIPDKGLGYGLLRYSGKIELVEQIATCSPPQVNFNYLGQFDQTLSKDSPFVLAEESAGTERDKAGLRSYELEVSACVVDNQLQISWSYGKARYHKKTINFLAQAYMSVLQELVLHCAMLEQEEFTPSDFPLARLDQSGLDLISRNKPGLEDIYPVSPLQQGLIFHSLYAPEAGMYCNQFSCMLTGELNTDMFLQAWRYLVARHPILRTAFLLDEVEQPLQLVYKNVEMPVDHVDWRNLSEEEQAQRWQEYLLGDRRKPFVFDQAPLMRFALIRCAAHRYYFLWSHHHALLDGWCTPLIFQEVFDVYEALSRKQKISSATGRPYRDYIAWLQMQDQPSAEKYWRAALQDFSTCTSFGPGVTPHAAENADNHGDRATYTVTLESESASQLVDFVRHHQLTLNTLMQGVWALFLNRYSNEQDVVFGITVSGRPAELVDVDRMIGLFINTVPLRVKVRPEVRVVDWLRALFEQNQVLRRFEYTPLTDIQKWSDIPNGQPLFESLLVFENFPVDWAVERNAEKIGIREIVFSEQTHYPMTITAAHVPAQGLVLRFEYWNDLFPEYTLVRMANHFQRLIESVVCTPDARLTDLSILTATERNQLLVDWNATEADYSQDRCIHELFEAQVEKDPDTVAVVFEDQQLTYAQLNAKANQLAHYLHAQGVGPEVLVGICVERSLEMVIGLLGILKAGGAYLPIDPDYPEERIAFMLEDAQPVLSLVHTATREVLPENISTVINMDAQWQAIAQFSEDNPSHTAQVQNLAYVIYTSGSTGKPKGSMLAHQGVVNRLEWMQRQYQLDASDSILQKTPFSFDVSVWEFFWPLLTGARLVVAPPGAHKDGLGIAQIVQDEVITVMHFVPSMLSVFLDAPDVLACRSLRHVICSGEALPVNLQNKFFEKLPAHLHNLYGPTEASIDVTMWPCKRYTDAAIVPIGRPIDNTQIYLLDTFLNPVPVGVAGELYIGGVGLARGYQNRAALTAERFIPSPFCKQSGERLYRTGDLARYRADGNIEYLGRTDHQVKIRGFRIELGEIETALLQHEQIKEAVAIVREDDTNDKRLVAYIVGTESALDIEAIRAHLKIRLPDYMIPAAFVFLDRLPLTTNGKLDRKSLPDPVISIQLTREYVAPRNPTEEILAWVWNKALQVERVGIDDNFFELGGDSIRSIEVVSLAREKGLIFSVEQLYRNPTIRELAQFVAKHVQLDHITRTLMPFDLVAFKDKKKFSEHIENAYPLASLQAGMIFHSQSDKRAYHIFDSVTLQCPFNQHYLESALTDVFNLHPILRTVFDFENFSEPLQLVYKKPVVLLQCSDLRHCDSAVQSDRVSAWRESEKCNYFNIDQLPLIRFHVHRLTDAQFQFSVTEHHAVLDGWSLTSMLNEVFQRYFNLLESSASDEVRAIDDGMQKLVAIEKNALAAEQYRDYWIQQLSTLEISLLPQLSAVSAQKTTTGNHWNQSKDKLPTHLSDKLLELARTLGVPLKSVLLAAHIRVLSVLLGKSNVTSGLVFNVRPETRDSEHALGVFLNTLPFSQKITNSNWQEFIKQTFDLECKLLQVRYYPLAALQRMRENEPLFNVVFNYTHYRVGEDILQSNKLKIVEWENAIPPNFSLEVGFDLQILSSEIELELSGNRIDTAQLERIRDCFIAVFNHMVDDSSASVGEHSFLSAVEQRQLHVWNATDAVYTSNCCIHQLFELRAEQDSQAIAVDFAGRQLTYDQLNAKANQLAHYLRARGVGPEVLVGICVERSLEMAIGLLGILKAGGAYMPIDPRYPQERIAFMLDDARPALNLVHAATRDIFSDTKQVVDLDAQWEKIAQYSENNPSHTARTQNLAYVIYTSGSTGKPKGAALMHDGIVNRLEWMQRQYRLDAQDRVLQKTPFSFDVSVWEFFWPLLTGARLVIAPPGAHRDGQHIARIVQDEAITVMHFVPSMMSAFLDVPDVLACKSLRHVICSGEALSASLQNKFYEKLPAQLHNLYGPTEASIDVTVWACERESEDTAVPIGRPIANTRIYLLDVFLNPVPVSVPGELYIGGVGLARCYQNRSALTAERFIPDPFSERPGARLYRTGDLARYRADGEIEYISRTDHQVKIRGFRIELGEIETALLQHEGIKEAVVIVREDSLEDKRLVAYITGNESVPDIETIRTYLKASLPDYMVPSAFVFLDHFPLTPNGKLDRKALPAPDIGEQLTHEYVAPCNPTEQILAGIWGEVLGVEKIGVHDNFFELGGHSLLVMQVVTKIRMTFDIDVPLETLFKTPTVGGLAQRIEEIITAEVEALSEAEAERIAQNAPTNRG